MVVTEEVSPLERKIIRQVEHYFGDFNLPKDKFMQECVKEDDGWLTIETLLKFKRLSDLSADGKVVLAALAKSDSGLLAIDTEGDGKVRRSPDKPLPENNDEHRKLVEARTAYAKGYDKENTTMNELLEYYAEHEPTIVNIQMRNYSKDKKKHFKGSIFMTFRDEECCTAFVEAPEKKYKGVELLLRMKQKAYLESKEAEYEEKRKQRNGGADKKNGAAVKEEESAKHEDDVKEENKLPKGTVLKLTGISGDISREDMKSKLEADYEVNIQKEGGDIAFITYNRGESEAKIRFRVENFGKTLMEKIEKAEKFVVKDIELKVSLLEGDEETEFLEESLRDMKNTRSKQKNHKRRHNDRDGGYGGRGGRGGGRGGKRFKRN